MHRFANPTQFLALSARALPWLITATVALLVFGLWQALFVSPPDYQQGDSVRIMYVHVPSAWLSLAIYVAMAGASASFLIWRHPLADIVARASAPIGACFTAVTLVSGSLWGKPMWGTYWAWDARLTSVLILFFLYMGYIALANAYAGDERGKKLCAILSLIGAINIPVIRYSVDWWNTLHQPASIIRASGIAIDSSMLWPLFSMGLAFLFYYMVVLIIRVRTELLGQKLVRLKHRRM